MKRRISIAGCLAVLFLAGVGVGVYLERNLQGGTSMPEVKESNGLAKDKSLAATEPKARTASVVDLPLSFASLGDDQFSPSYLDADKKTLYPWNGVVLRHEQLPQAYKGGISGLRLHNARHYSQIVSVEGLVRYREVDGKYRPGYFFWPTQAFLEWKGIVLSREKVIPRSHDGQNSVLELDAIGDVIEIDIPVQMKEQTWRWMRP